MSTARVCERCGKAGELKRGWTNAEYCSERCERNAVSSLHNSMPGGPNPYIGWLPHHISEEIKRRWESTERKEQ